MKNHIAVMKWDGEGRVEKYLDFEVRADAIAHVNQFAAQYPNAFVATRPGATPAGDWKVQGNTLVVSPRPPEPRRESKDRQCIRILAGQFPQDVQDQINAIIGA